MLENERLRQIAMVVIVLLGVVLIAVLAKPTHAQDDCSMTGNWTAPTTGTEVVHYVVQLSINGGDFETIGTTPETTMTFPCAYGTEYVIRVAGVDARTRQGIWSEVSNTWIDDGPPGQPGTPTLTGTIVTAAIGLLGLVLLVLWFWRRP